MMKSILLLPLLVVSGQAFLSPFSLSPKAHTSTLGSSSSDSNSFVDGIQTSFRIAKESNAEGNGFKQILADVLAGDDYDKEAVSRGIEETIASAPCVMYTWENSPSCKKAVEAFETIGADVKIVRLDDPWEEGNPIRAVLGRKVGRTSVPFVFVGGEYIGGFDGGIDSEVAPGMVDLAFKGKLRDMLGEAGAMK
mmetsp:Transcript_20779/g.57691  ORF Transcript_20779/g.57691 Transcript_20779/m.57691 type:complete len:194 (+) Transcript_20779:1253-1834(+)|eukprot:CAMPEP_0172381032 /NCGR_PEP_ID=MMETSP1060-20121228/70739_1 /TAXON_ID=37318 /ORGANISM="Pseudo-nitzschia pungens, Strain cf. cingulata" /LENGTH=193 /DNA_ID=CAMNT_0013108799 /DNA_START=3142 /DNA_END=3723 /DNA_ORIENTATION=-